jgi:hypothetical protein
LLKALPSAPNSFGGALGNAFNNSSPDYYVGLNLNIPLRNRVAKSDQYRSELEFRQAGLRLEQLKKEIRIEVRNAQYALEQSGARVDAARKARDLAQRGFDISTKEQELGAGSNLQTLTARRDLATAESALVAALTAQRKAAVELDRATGTTLEANGISIEATENSKPAACSSPTTSRKFSTRLSSCSSPKATRSIARPTRPRCSNCSRRRATTGC